MPSPSKATAFMMALISLASSEIQITQPAPKASTLALEPNPVVHWVYTSSDPDVVGIVVRQAKTDDDYQPLLTLFRGGTPISMSSAAIPLNTLKFKEGMNVTITITELTDENQNEPLQQKVLASRGPLRLVNGSNDIQPMGTTHDSATASSTDIASSTAHADGTSHTESATTDNSAGNSATATTDHFASTASSSATSGETSDAAAAAPSSDAARLDAVTTLYIITLVLTAIPAFLFGYNP
jgi:hypothetical protein